MQGLGAGLLKAAKSVGDMVMPLMTASQFAESGVLTHEEFVRAGDQLVFSCPTWQWCAAPKGQGVDYLPPNKQYLITRNVPSLRRAHTYALADAKEEMLPSEAADGGSEGWLSTHSEADVERNREVADIDEQLHGGSAAASKAPVQGKSAAAAASSAAAATSAAAAPAAAAADDDEVGDIDDLDADLGNLVVQPPKPAAAAAPAKPAAAASATAAAEESPDMEAFDDDDNVVAPASSTAPPYLRAEEPEDNLVKTRTYDLSIVYDKWYRTPRVYLFGYDEHRQPLTPKQIMEDISADHANKTVTVESHPFLGVAHASIHPCKHAHVMKRIVDQMQSYRASEGSAGQAKLVPVEHYLFLFLKFMSSVMPTIEYDFTG